MGGLGTHLGTHPLCPLKNPRPLLRNAGNSKQTERGGFEPPMTRRPYWISNPAHSTALPPLQAGRKYRPKSGEVIPTFYQPRTYPKISGATIVASDSTMKLGVSTASFSQVIFSLGTAPEYDP